MKRTGVLPRERPAAGTPVFHLTGNCAQMILVAGETGA